MSKQSWRKSARSADDRMCVELRAVSTEIYARDSKQAHASAVLALNATALRDALCSEHS